MQNYALIIDGVFKEARSFAERPADIPHKKVQWFPIVSEKGEVAFTGIRNGEWVVCLALPSLEELRSKKLADVSRMRWKKETGGIVVNGAQVATDETSQTKLIGAVVGSQIDPTASMKWKMKNGAFVTLDSTSIVAVAMAVHAHIQACFNREADLKFQIEAAGTKAALEAIDISAGWPT